MFTQFFGSYLLNNKIVSHKQLQEALEISKSTHLKLGVLAINAGYMTAEQVDKVHVIQSTLDKRIGDIAVDMGFLTEEQVNELLSSQQASYLSLGQALVDKRYMSTTQFEQAINNYKKENEMEYFISDIDQNKRTEEIISNFYDFENSLNNKIYSEYITLLFKNIIRFIGDDFIPMKPYNTHDYSSDCLVTQEIVGDFNIFVAINCDENSFINLASQFAKEQFTKIDEYTNASVGEFLNLQDGLFCVNMSNEKGLELDLKPQQIHHKKVLKNSNVAYLIPISFPFGTIDFIIGSYEPLIY